MDMVLSLCGLGGPEAADSAAALQEELKGARETIKNLQRVNGRISWDQRKVSVQMQGMAEKEKKWEVKVQEHKWEVDALKEEAAWQDALLQTAQKDRTLAVLLCMYLSKECAQMKVEAQNRPATAMREAGACGDGGSARIAELEKALSEAEKFNAGLTNYLAEMEGRLSPAEKCMPTAEACGDGARTAEDRVTDLGRRVAALESELSTAGAAGTRAPTAEAVAEHLAAAATLQMELAAISESVAAAGARTEAAVATLKQLASANAAIGRDVAQLGSCAVEPCRALEVASPMAAVEGGCCASPRLSEELPSGLACAVGESSSPAVSADAAAVVHAPAPAPVAAAAARKAESAGLCLSLHDSCSVLRPCE